MNKKMDRIKDKVTIRRGEERGYEASLQLPIVLTAVSLTVGESEQEVR